MRLSYSFKNNSTLRTLFSQKGFTLPIVAIFVLAFLVAPVAFWFSSSRETAVKGAEASNLENGISIKVISSAGSWDLAQYLCKNESECASSLTSGKKWESLSGGVTQGSSKRLNTSEALTGYDYVKVFVKPGWGADNSKNFKVTVQPQGSEIQTLEKEGVRVVLIPLAAIESAKYTQILFTDQL
jgi:hypothetical protein